MHLSDVVYHGQPRGWACRQRAHEIDDIVCDPVARLMARFVVVGGVLFQSVSCHRDSRLFHSFRHSSCRFGEPRVSFSGTRKCIFLLPTQQRPGLLLDQS